MRIGEVRRGQLIYTFGIGSIVDLPKHSVMIAGQPDWHGRQHLFDKIHEPRLEAKLGVNSFWQPKHVENKEHQQPIPCVRFPRWVFCPTCLVLAPWNWFGALADVDKCPNCDVKLLPARFVVACEDGHIDDFPWEWWIKRRGGCACDTPALRISNTGRSTALADIVIECTNQNCNGRRSLDRIFSRGALAGFSCTGLRPWLRDTQPGCGKELRVLQRGSTSVYFPTTASAISIPPCSSSTFKLLENQWMILDPLQNQEEALMAVLTGISQTTGYSVDQLRAACTERWGIKNSDTELDILGQEYDALVRGNEGDDKAEFKTRSACVAAGFENKLASVILVERLRIVTALKSFQRISAGGDGEPAPLSNKREFWLPGTEVHGEGIFILFDKDAIDSWKANLHDDLRQKSTTLSTRRQDLITAGKNPPDADITPEFLLIHTFSHILMRALTINCGYSTSALAERIYVREESPDVSAMHGVLIYTAAGDSEGSLGGLVRQGNSNRLGAVLATALEAAKWCSSDPLCMESTGQGRDALNMAACHSCALVPETACTDFRNCFLDREHVLSYFA